MGIRGPPLFLSGRRLVLDPHFEGRHMFSIVRRICCGPQSSRGSRVHSWSLSDILLDKLSKLPSSTARLTCQTYVSQVHNRRASSLSFKPTVGPPSNLVLDTAYVLMETLGDHVLTRVVSGRDLCCFSPVS